MRISAIVFGVGLALAGSDAARPESVATDSPAVRSTGGAAGAVAIATPHRASGRHSSPRIGIHFGSGYSHHGYGYRGWGSGWPGYWSPWYGAGFGYGYGPGWGYTTAYPRAGARYGALDTDIAPERAEVWVDGERVGVADDFDGFPDYLWLERGTYDVVFYMAGRLTLARQYTIYPGLVIDVGDRLEPGEAIHPLDLGPKTHERRDERLRRDRETREYAERMERGRASRPEAEEIEPDESLDARGEPGRLELRVTPDDASIYLDGRFLGTAIELQRLRAGLLVDAGGHVLEVVRPGYRAVELDVTVEEGEAEKVEVELEAEPGEGVN